MRFTLIPGCLRGGPLDTRGGGGGGPMFSLKSVSNMSEVLEANERKHPHNCSMQ